MKTPRSKTVERPVQVAPAIPPKFFALIPANAGIDFVKLSPRMAMLSCALILLGFVSMFLRGGLNYGIDFTGGTSLEARAAMRVASPRAACSSAVSLGSFRAAAKPA